MAIVCKSKVEFPTFSSNAQQLYFIKHHCKIDASFIKFGLVTFNILLCEQSGRCQYFDRIL